MGGHSLNVSAIFCGCNLRNSTYKGGVCLIGGMSVQAMPPKSERPSCEKCAKDYDRTTAHMAAMGSSR